ncbi:GFA family protein [Kiloniella laminariae]|uniref:GFA family protein n=1 Tax=Kiloniella laminariae TaxID=454162 RepID=A0ABT4LJ11_9PROT|nr:GFA family protein [Kiloniella laminariae]MCZ4281096.1 GFA family protein [Kiloniella laminariae]
MIDVLEGGCFCGKVRYKTSCLDSAFKVNCHCRNCQKLSGAAYISLLGVPENSFSVTGEVTCFETTGGSGKKMRTFFCASCNSRLYGKPEIGPGLVLIGAATLDRPELYRPTADMFVKNALPWDSMDDTIPKFDAFPPRRS